MITPADQGADLVVLDADELVIVGEGASGPRRGREQSTVDVVENGSMYVSGGWIRKVGTAAEVTSGVDLATVRVVDARGRIVLPGLVDAHTHPLFAGDRVAEYAMRLGGRSRAEIAARGGGIGETVRTSRAADDDVLLAALDAFLARMPAFGVTTVEVKSGYGQSTEHELRHLSVIETAAERAPVAVVPTFLGAHVVPDGFDAAAYADLIVAEMLPAVVAQGVARTCDVCCGPFSPTQCSDILRRAAELGLSGRMHADSAASGRGWQTAAACGVVTADHLTFTPEAEIDEVGPVPTAAVLVPYAELVYFTPTRAPARKFIDNEVPVVIASDYSSSIAAPPLYQVLPFAAAWYRMTPAEVLAATTANAAYALGLGSEVGTLTAGKRADFIVVDVPDHRALVYEFGQHRIERTYLAGELAYARDEPREPVSPPPTVAETTLETQ